MPEPAGELLGDQCPAPLVVIDPGWRQLGVADGHQRLPVPFGLEQDRHHAVLIRRLPGRAAELATAGLPASQAAIFSFGDAIFYGSTGAITLARPIVGMATR